MWKYIEKTYLGLIILLLGNFGCTPEPSIYKSIFLEDFENIEPSLENSKLVSYVLPLSQVGQYSSVFELDTAVIKIRRERLNDYRSQSLENFNPEYGIDQLNIEFFILKYSGNELEKPLDFESKLLDIYYTQDLNSYRGVYNACRLLNIYADYQYEISANLLCFAAFSNTLHILYNFDPLDELYKIKEKFALALLKSLIREYDSIEEISPSKEYIRSIFKDSFWNSFSGLMLQAHLNVKNHKKSIDFLRKAESRAASVRDQFVVNYNLALTYEDLEDIEQASHYYYKAFQAYNGFSCDRDFLAFLVNCLIFEKDPTLLHEYEESALNSVECNELDQEFFRFIKHYRGLVDLNDSLNIISKLMDVRSSAEKVFSNKSTFHIQDFYLDNTIDIMVEFMSRKRMLTKENQQMLVQLYFDTKYKDLYRQKYMYKVDSSMSENGVENSVEKLLLDVNYFKNTRDFTNEKYRELFDLLSSRSISTVPLITPELNFNELVDKIARDSMLVLNMIKGYSNYYLYILDENHMVLDTIPNSVVDSLMLEFQSKVVKDRKQKICPKYIFEETLFKIDPEKKKKIAFIADGHFVQLPIEVLFKENEKVIRLNTVQSLVKNENLFIKKSKISLCSYSDENVNNLPLKYPELTQGYYEIFEISKVLNLEANQSFVRDKFDKRVLWKGKSRMLHFSTHASSSMTNRLDNYILTRHNEEKLYGFELYEATNLPEVVVLSACESGIGLHAYGAGVQTLSRAFLDNGTKTVIKTLWKVNEIATKKFMIEMYTNWAKGMSLYDALEKTKDRFKYDNEYCAPYYWAGFVLEGNPNVYLDSDPQ